MSDAVKDVRFHLLGPIQVFVGPHEIAIAGRDRTLLVALLCHADTPVEIDRLVDAIWGERPPRDARNQLQSCVSRLRKRFVAAGVVEPIIITEPAGYQIKVDANQLDLKQFREAVAEARTVAGSGRPDVAIAGYRTALAMWRGPALAGLDSSLLRRLATGLDEEHLQAVEERFDLELAHGGAGELVAELTDLVAKHPYREKLHAALMLALYRAGRQAEALAAFQRARRTLVDEVGAEPGPALRQMHQRILSNDPTLVAQSPAGEAAPSARHCLPRTVSDFTGREGVVAELIQSARASIDRANLILIDGMAGVGKTTLAVHAAHLMMDDFPDGQLFIDLHGHGGGYAMTPATALSKLLRQLGLPNGRIPAEMDDRLALWRHELADRRVLLLLDNAVNSAQVQPLVPAGSECLTLITSRRRLTGLEAARLLSLDVFAPDEATMLLERIVGDRVRHERDAVEEVARRCGYLPLAIRLAGARLVHRSSWRIQDFVGRLNDSSGLLTELVADDRGIGDLLALSYQQLSARLQRIFRLLGLYPGEDFDAYAVAALAHVSLEESREALDTLVDHHLVDEARTGRYQLHDLVREYAKQLTLTKDDKASRRAAIEQLFDFYLHATVRAAASFERPTNRRRFRLAEPRRPELLADPLRKAVEWLEESRPNLVAAVVHAAATGFESYAWQMASAAWRFYYSGGYIDDIIATHRCGLHAAEVIADDHAIGVMCNYLASAYNRLGEYAEAARLVQRSIGVWRKVGDSRRIAIAQMNLGIVHHERGHSREAIRLLQTANATHQRIGNIDGMGMCQLNLGNALMRIGRYEEAMFALRRSLAIAREVDDMTGRTLALAALGALRIRIGSYDMAWRMLTSSLAIRRKVGIQDYMSEAMSDLGTLYRRRGNHREAVGLQRRALTIAFQAGDRSQEYAARNDIGISLREAGNKPAALEQHRTALAGTIKIGMEYEQARALDGIAACLCDTDRAEARRHWQRALVLYREMGVPEQTEVARRLEELGGVEGDLAPRNIRNSGAQDPPPPHQAEREAGVEATRASVMSGPTAGS